MGPQPVCNITRRDKSLAPAGIRTPHRPARSLVGTNLFNFVSHFYLRSVRIASRVYFGCWDFPNCEGSKLLGLLLVFLELCLMFEIISLYKSIFSVPEEVILRSHLRIRQRLANLARAGNFPPISC